MLGVSQPHTRADLDFTVSLVMSLVRDLVRQGKCPATPRGSALWEFTGSDIKGFWFTQRSLSINLAAFLESGLWIFRQPHGWRTQPGWRGMRGLTGDSGSRGSF